MSNDILDQLRNFRPAVQDMDRRWPADSRAELAERIRQDQLGAQTRLRHRPRSSRARLIAASTLVAAAAVAAVAVPALLPGGTRGGAAPAAAAALHRLARIAANAPIDVAGLYQFVHTITREHQVGILDDGTNKPSDYTTTYEAWTASDGRLWRQQTSAGSAPVTLFFPAKDGGTTYLASLPTSPDEFDRYLREHAIGSDSTDEAVFVAIGDDLRDQTAPAALRSAAMTVLARTNHVSLGSATTDSLGRKVQEFDFVDQSKRPGTVKALYFDPRTAQLIDERTTSPQNTDTTSVLVSDVVNSVPAHIVHTAVPQK